MTSTRQRAASLDLGNFHMINPNEFFYNFNTLVPSIDEIFKKRGSFFKNLPPFMGQIFTADTRNNIARAFASTSQGMLYENPPDILIDFYRYASEIFTKTDSWNDLLSYWPPRVINTGNQIRALIYLIIEIAWSTTQPYLFIDWLSIMTSPKQYRNTGEIDNQYVRGASLGYRKRRLFKETSKFWAILDTSFKLFMYRIEERRDKNGQKVAKLVEHIEPQDVHSIRLSKSGKTIKYFKENGDILKRFVPFDRDQPTLWRSLYNPHIPSFPRFLGDCAEPYPKILLHALYDAICNGDNLILKALTHWEVTEANSGNVELMDAFFTIYAYSNKIIQFYNCIVSDKFNSDSINTENVCRTNTHLCNLYKVIIERFGDPYYNNFLCAIVKYIDNNGDLGLDNLELCDQNKLKKKYYTIVDKITRSLSLVPNEIRHFLSVIEYGVSNRFNSKAATYNVLSSFFFLQFICDVILNPTKYDQSLKLRSPDKVFEGSADFLTKMFSLSPMKGKYEALNNWNKLLFSTLYPRLVEFLFSFSVREAPTYSQPSKDELESALCVVLKYIGLSQGRFAREYERLQKLEHDRTPLSFAFTSYFVSYFKQNLTLRPVYRNED